MTAGLARPTLSAMSHDAGSYALDAPTRSGLARDRGRQETTLQVFKVLTLPALALMEITGINGTPAPNLSETGLPVTFALIGIAVGTLGAVHPVRVPAFVTTILLVTLALSSGALFSLQPFGPAICGAFLAAGAASLQLPRRNSAVVLLAALLGLTVPQITGDGHPLEILVMVSGGPIAFYAMGEVAQRSLRGQELASRLLAELEESQQARADAAALAERQRLAREMHDVLAHSLSGLVVQLEAARLLARRQGTDPETSAALERALHLGKSGLDEARRAIGMLRGDELPGPETLAALVGEFERDARVPCSFDVAGTERELSTSARLTLYRVAQEALTNVRRHAIAESVAVQLAYEPAGTRLTVEDFGSGGASAADMSRGGEGGYGITGMRERAELLGGRLGACPTERGFRVELWVPA